jgi:6-pyruvoyltetrahydropterin/6-carboxytetrahydropterin synthase
MMPGMTSGDPTFEVTRRVRFEAAHYLPDDPGKCGRVHGHSWQAWITVAGPPQPGGPEEGMVVEMGRVAALFRDHLEPGLDHQLLNETLPPEYLPPTTENVAAYLLDRYRLAGFPVVRVRVAETENQSATVAV